MTAAATWTAIGVIVAFGSLVVSVVALILMRRSDKRNAGELAKTRRENSDAVAKAQATADEANSLSKERLHAEVLPYLAFRRDDSRGPTIIWYENTGNGPAHDIQIDSRVADDCPPDRTQEAESIIREWVKLCQGKTLWRGEREPVASREAMLPFVEVRSLTFEDQYRKRFTFSGRADDLRPVGESKDESSR